MILYQSNRKFHLFMKLGFKYLYILINLKKEGDNMYKTDFRFDFNKVGQGLFYSGDIGEFNFIYDCGCGKDLLSNLGRKVIGPYKRRLRRKAIDLLVISHFHNDHTNGLDSLLRGLDLNIVVIPYFTPFERLIISLSRDFSNWYYFFLKDPVSYFINKGARRIIIIGGEKSEKLPSPDEIPSNPPEGEEPIIWKRLYKNGKNIKIKDIMKINFEKIEISKISDDEDKKLEKNIFKNDPQWEKYNRNELLIRNHDKRIIVSGLWIFIFFNCKLEKDEEKEQEKLNRFKKCLQENGLDNSESIKEAITNKNRRDELKKCYEENLDKKLNNTSLLVYHGPIGNFENKTSINCRKGLSFKNCWLSYYTKKHEKCNHPDENKMGQFLIGDINLNNKYKYNEIKNHYKNWLDSIFLSQIPHHGSKYNWNNDILNDLKNCHQWIASSGCSENSKHPHRDVILNILENDRCFCWSNQYSQFFIEGLVTWE